VDMTWVAASNTCEISEFRVDMKYIYCDEFL